MALRLDWGKGIKGQYTLSFNSHPNPRSDALRGGGSNTTPIPYLVRTLKPCQWGRCRA